MRTLLIALLIVPLSTFAQITVNGDDLPSVDSTYVVSSASLLNDYDFTETGENFNWNFDALEESSSTQSAFISIDDAPLAYQFLFNNPFDQDYLADFAQSTEGFSVAQFSLQNFYQFFKKTAEAYEIVGYGATVNDIPIPGQTNPIDEVYALPIAYNDTHSSYSEWQVEIPTLGYYRLQQDRSYEVDGWGSVTTPAGTFNALRLRMEINATDSVYVDFIGQGLTFDRNSVEYVWLAEDEGIPVLRVVETFGQVSQVEYKSADQENPSLIAAKAADAWVLYPTVTSGQVTLADLPMNATVQLLDASGRNIEQLGFVRTLDLSGQKAGMYWVEVRTDQTVSRKRVIVAR